MQLTAAVFNAGLGDLSLGLTSSGFKIITAYEPDQKACAVHNINIDAPVHHLSLDEIDTNAIPAVDLLAAHLHLRPTTRRNAFCQENDATLGKFCDILNHCKPRAFLILLNTSFLKSSGLPLLLDQMNREHYQLTYEVIDVSQMTGFPVKESMAYIIGINQAETRSTDFAKLVHETSLPPDPFLQLKQPVDPWYYRISSYDTQHLQEGNTPFLCWKNRSYQNADRVQWNFMKIPLVRDSRGVRKITHREIATLKGFPASFRLPDTDRQWLYQKLIYSGNVLVIKQISGVLSYILTDNPWRSQQVDQGIKFENLFGKYLTNLAQKTSDISFTDNSANLIHNYRADFSLQYQNNILYFDIKQYKSDFALQSNLKKLCMRLAPLASTGIPILVVPNKVPQSQKTICEKEYGVHIWDVANLLWIFESFPDIKTEFIATLDFSIEHIEPEASTPVIIPNDSDTSSKELGWKEKLLRIAPGQEQFSKYEHVCTDILKYVLGDYLTLWAEQQKSNDGLYRFDLCCKIKSGADQDFFDTIKHYFNTKYIVFEFKNYTQKITQKEIYTTEKYLYEKALRKVAIIISRSGPDEHALQAAKGSLRENGKLIICLSDNSLLEMIDIKDRGEQEPAEFLGAILDDLLVHLEK